MGVEFCFCDEKGKDVDSILGCKNLWHGYVQTKSNFAYQKNLKDIPGLDEKGLDSEGMRRFAADILNYLKDEHPWALKEDAETYRPDLEELRGLVEAQDFDGLLSFYKRKVEIVEIFESGYWISQILQLKEFKKKLTKYAEVENMYAYFSY